MKKQLIFFSLILSLSITGYSQNVNKLLDMASKNEHTEKIKIGGSLMSLSKMIGDVGDMPLTKGVKRMAIYDLSSCSADFKQEIMKQFKNIKDSDGYETMMYAKEKNGGIRIMLKKKKETIREVLLLCMDKSNPVIIQFSGKMKESDIDSLLDGITIN